MKEQEPTLARKPWSLETIPAELKEFQQWVTCYRKGEKGHKSDKVPIGGPTNVFTQKKFKDLKEITGTDARCFGFAFQDEDPYVVVDVDELGEDFTFNSLPKPIQELLTEHPTYVEASPSGQGLHIWYKADKQKLAHRKDQDKGTNQFKGSVFIRNQYCTCTGWVFLRKPIAVIDAHTFESLTLTAINKPDLRVVPKGKRQTLSRQTLSFSMIELENAINKLPPTLSESPYKHLIEAQYAKFTPPITGIDDYMHWQYMAAAINYTATVLGQKPQGGELYAEWSGKARTKLASYDEAIEKYYQNNPKFDGNDLTHKTILALANSLKPEWPYPKRDKKGVSIGIPILSNMHNWDALFELHQIKLMQNEITKAYRFVAPTPLAKSFPSNVEHTNRSALESSLLWFSQQYMRPEVIPREANSYVKQLVCDANIETYNPTKEWLDSLPPHNPKRGSHFQALWETLTLPKDEMHREPLYRAMLKKNLMGIIRAHYYTGRYSESTGIVILQGPEKTYKSTWIKQLLPRHLENYLVASQSQASKKMKELQMEAGVCQIWVRDEVEAFFEKGYDSTLKNFLVQKDDFFRPLFAGQPIAMKRKCIFFGTTNQQEINISGQGSRRIQIIPVQACDTNHKVDIGKVYKELLYEFEQTLVKDQPSLWILSDAEQEENNLINTVERRTETEGDTLLKETYAFEQDFDLTQFTNSRGTIDKKVIKTLTAIQKDLRLKHNRDLNIPALRHALKRHCGAWTDTKTETLTLGSWNIKEGWAVLKAPGTKKISCSGFMMPPHKDFTEEVNDIE